MLTVGGMRLLEPEQAGRSGEERGCTRPFFVVGAQRSGTTLLRLMLDRHPRLAVPHESHFIPELARAADAPASAEAFLSALEQSVRFQEWQVPLDEVRARLPDGPLDWRGAFDAAFRAYAAREGKARWGDKTPGYVRHVELLRCIFPDLQLIHLVRDGRDVALSLLDVSWYGGRLADAARLWAADVESGRAAAAALTDDAYLEVRYEDLVADPEAVLRRVCRFLGEAFAPRMLGFHETAGQKIPGHRQAWHARTTAPMTDESVGRWRTALSGRDRALFQRVAGAGLGELGYPLESASPAARLASLPAWAAWRARRAVGRLRGRAP